MIKESITLTLFLVVLIGCSKPIECEPIVINNTINNTVTNTITEIKYIETIQYVNNTCNKTVYEYKGTTSRELELIRRISFLEGQQDKYWNFSECDWELNESNKDLEYCEEELCKINSSWC